MKNCYVFVTVRTNSKRLPKKALKKINGVPMIKILINRIKLSKKLSNLVVCTTSNKSDDKLVNFLTLNDIDVFRGNNRDILKRLLDAAKKFNVNYFVEVDGDDLFCDLELIEKTCLFLRKTDYDFISWEGLPFGSSPIGIRTKKLEELVKKKINKITETGWGQLIIDSKLFNHYIIKPEDKKLNRPEIRLTIDYKEDFLLAKKIIENLPDKFNLYQIIQLLDKNPTWLKLNKFAMKKYRENFKKKKTQIQLKK